MPSTGNPSTVYYENNLDLEHRHIRQSSFPNRIQYGDRSRRQSLLSYILDSIASETLG